MLVLLPPSETKSSGGQGPALRLSGLSWPELEPVRRRVADALVGLAGDVPASLSALGLSERQEDEVARNARLWSAPTAPALLRYTGVLFDALGAPEWGPVEWERAGRRLAVCSALFGLLRATDRVPAYRLSAGSRLPGLPAPRTVWRPVLAPLLAGVEGLVVDLRSGAYAAFAPVPGAVTVRVLSEDAGGGRTVVSHHNKAHKGRLARVLATAGTAPADIEGVTGLALAAGMRAEPVSDTALDLVVPRG
ncbi:peroxide stress protein YaaA [Actinoalloteichus sp. AHMU CJ021]|uniref:Peroxide stress protein YaaA n=2 Tax=Actinoalloteichus cyanogriseus TaxID=2893586 RepID=A0ABT1JQE7_ACTCY|nr:peroxide stress protein YaaA [Actinoalloteichus caeruleus]AUS80183.1 peroxide stress protein YaaA [Actinoalloteichus sp. AHMU CJ021]MCP2334409.1 hypothetical protein [Actinoalloteichus caeruleus DSM 43889]